MEYVFSFQYIVEVPDEDLEYLEEKGISAPDFEQAVLAEYYGSGLPLYVYAVDGGRYVLGNGELFEPEEAMHRVAYGPINPTVVVNRVHKPKK